MRVLVTGSRDWDDRIGLTRMLHAFVVVPHWEPGFDSEGVFVDYIKPHDFVLVHGANPKGADHWADQWCLGWNFVAERHPANWDEFGKSAGFIRNQQMVDSGIDLCLAFQKNKSRGTQHTIDRALHKGIETIVWSKP